MFGSAKHHIFGNRIYDEDIVSPHSNMRMCRSFLGSYKDKNGEYVTDSRFNQGVYSINLVRCAIMANHDESDFYENLQHSLDLCFEGLMLRHEMLKTVKAKQNPILFMYGANARLEADETIEKLLYDGFSSISIGYVGLHNAMVALYGKSYFESDELLEKGKRIIQYMRDFCDNKKEETNIGFSLYSTPAEVLATKFCRSDIRDFGEIEGVNTNGYYENSFHYPSNSEVSPFEKIDLESKFQPIANGGFISYCEFGNMKHNHKAIEDVVSYAMDKVGYFGVNVRADKCLKCGYEGLIEPLTETENDYVCPSCDNDDKSKLNVVIRLCGYISSLSERPSCDGKMKEMHSRYTHVGERK